ncbi:MAG: hypothetical protein OK454_02855, partial [Thaumarchaeota archaeon]|nr:hypothetical protein [Nitrososphaerota archaeon]
MEAAGDEIAAGFAGAGSVPVTLSRAAVLDCTGLAVGGDVASSSLFWGDITPRADPVSVPDCESADPFLVPPGRAAALL